MSSSVPDKRASGTPPEENAYHGTDEDGCEAYVCWECATAEERTDPANNDAVGEQCGRCRDVWWDYADAEAA